MTKTTSLALALVSAVSFGLACSSSSSSPTSSVSTAAHEDSGGGSSGSGSSGCVQGSAKDMDLSCGLFDTSGLSSAEVTALNDNCTKVMGTVVTTCPTTDLTGCCTTTVEGATQVTCVYSVSAASGESACKEQSGTWSTTP